MDEIKKDAAHGHLQIKLGVSGAAETGHCGVDAYDKGLELGRQIAKHGAMLVTGATTGFPMWAAMGAVEAGGFSLGFSPATGEKEHVEKYNLPLEYMDAIVYTGFGYPGRDLIFTNSCDGMLFGCGQPLPVAGARVFLGDRSLLLPGEILRPDHGAVALQ